MTDREKIEKVLEEIEDSYFKFDGTKEEALEEGMCCSYQELIETLIDSVHFIKSIKEFLEKE